MKKIFFSLIVVINISCKAQNILPIERMINYIEDEDKGLLDDGISYVKDVNGILNKFVGTWKGSYQNKNYEFKISKNTKQEVSIKKDRLIIRYKITDSRSGIRLAIANTLNLPTEDGYIITGDYLARNGSYVLDYFGLKGECGQNGTMFINVKDTTPNLMDLFLHVKGEIYHPECTTGYAAQVMPIEGITLTKQ